MDMNDVQKFIAEFNQKNNCNFMVGAKADKILNALKRTEGYCPCVAKPSENNICPCHDFRTKMDCHCSLFVKE